MRKFILLLLSLPVLLLICTAGDITAVAANIRHTGESSVNPDDPWWSENWAMAGANPGRTSWTAEEVRGSLKPIWYKPFESYISQKVQIIGADGLLYISTADGLYALHADTGQTAWVYPTEFPLGHSPTIYNGTAYVAGFDRKLHAINAQTGQGLWTFEAEAGFQTNPLVVDSKVYLGNRDGTFYAIHAEGENAGELAWSYETDGPILFSAAYKDSTVFFASNDSYAYALDAQTGLLIWKSAKLPGSGFNSWWPVIYRDRVIFAGRNNYRFGSDPGPASLIKLDQGDVFPNHKTDPRGTLVGPLGTEPGDWAVGTPTIDATRILDYFAAKPWRRTNLVLDQATGQEMETAPILWVGVENANRYPPIVGSDDVLYQQNNFKSDPAINGGHLSGWKIGSPYISIANDDWNAIDEPMGYSAGGDLIYWNRCCDRVSGSFDVAIPETIGGGPTQGGERQEFLFFVYNLSEVLPGYNVRYFGSPDSGFGSFRGPNGGENGMYGYHADTNPPIPFEGKVFMHRSNAVIAFANYSGEPTAWPVESISPAPASQNTPVTTNELVSRLEDEVQKMVNAGHLRPSLISHTHFDVYGRHECGDGLAEYWHNSAETIYSLLLALPHISPALRQQVQTYLANELSSYPPYQYNFVGWNGAPREPFIVPDDMDLSSGPTLKNNTFESNGGWQGLGVWGRNPFLFYALWKYADTYGGAQALFTASENSLAPLPAEEVLLNMPLVHNAFIVGYWGYLELEALAGLPESANVRSELDYLLALRANNFTKDSSYTDFSQGGAGRYCSTMNIASNFMYLVPELADYLRSTNLANVQTAVQEYEHMAPYWFVSKAQEGFGENGMNTLHDAHALFMAKAMILEEPGEQLVKYLDVPAVAVGDLFYIQKLAITIERLYGFSVTNNTPIAYVETGGIYAFQLEIGPSGGFTGTVTVTADTNLPMLNVNISPTTVNLESGPKQVVITLTDLHTNLTNGWWHVLPITISGGDISHHIELRMLVNGEKTFLTFISK